MIKLTVFFDDPFWVGVFERNNNYELEVSRVVFGEEPKDNEIYNFILNNFYRLKFSQPISSDHVYERKINPKRMHRKIRNTVRNDGIGTKAQQAIKLDLENRKNQRKAVVKERREQQEKIKFEKKQQKKKQKKRGH
ncbi:YjdF family protein [Clostridium oryzae]|uniref:DUF2992 family protein n=1 Tax=Clostridium oryzae TaxID=1450648 RepID=A0A1V4IMB9_9CLOT|nr:YjdF family protein [Clostridium oryzae]OPJ60970.1 hypothetical protein CLORY_25190 [Clostridium oryzae]